MSFLDGVIFQLFKESAQSSKIRPIGGGCINQTGEFEYKGTKYFLKWNRNAHEIFEAEAKGLSLLSQSQTIYIPNVIGTGTEDSIDFLCLEFVTRSSPSHNFWAIFGRQLAALHSQTQFHFGLDHHNYIGSLPQSNLENPNWIDFFVSERLLPQLKRATNKGLIDSTLKARFEKLFNHLPKLIPKEKPSLLHGDLWSGNFLVGNQGQPVIFDPAVHYGHREAELAFTHLFGGFDSDFYSAYNEAFPLTQGHQERVDIFNLYPLLVHVNLFGASYLSGIVQTLSRFA